jgi:hypothetical protein
MKARRASGALLLVAILAGGCALLPVFGDGPESVRAQMINLGAQLQCDGAPQGIGGEMGQIPPTGGTGTASPYPWIESLTDIDLPLSGYVEVPKVAWENGAAALVRHEYRAGGRVKAIIVMAGHSVDGGQGHWDVVAFRACAGDEFDPKDGRTTDNSPWLDVQGQPADVTAFVGPGHCGWQSTLWLRVDGRLYLRDPVGVMSDYTVAPFLPNAAEPAGMHATGIHSRDRALFTAGDKQFVWVRTSRGLERWAGVSTEPGCM